MKTAPTKAQIALVGGILLLTILLLFAQRVPDKQNDVKAMLSGHAGNQSGQKQPGVREYLDSSLIAIKADTQIRVADKERLGKWMEAVEKASPSERPQVIDKLVSFFDSLRKPAASAFYQELKAQQTNSRADWTKAGDRFYVGSKYFPSAHALIDSAILAYGRVLKMDPKDLNAKTSMGVCFVEGTNQPMQGITLLQEVLKADSNYVDALLNLGSFAITSGQFEKAISRFKRVLELRPDYILLNVRIAEAYQKMGDKAKTIEYLERYVKLEKDVMLRTEIQNEINKLKNS